MINGVLSETEKQWREREVINGVLSGNMNCSQNNGEKGRL